MGKFDEPAEQRGYTNGMLRGQMLVCEAILSGELVAYIEAETGRPLPELAFEPYMTPDPQEEL